MLKDEGLSDFFQKYVDQASLFQDKKVFQPNFTPEKLEHRDEQMSLIASTLAPCLKLDKPSNLFIYGKTGSGKTLTVKYVTSHIRDLAQKQDIPIRIMYLNCKLKKVADTEYRLVAQLAKELGKNVPTTGLPTDEVYNIFYQAVDEQEQVVLLVLDEIDQLIQKAGDAILYNLTRINSELKKAQISLIGISNDLVFTDVLDPRIKSSLSEEEIIFPPYNAIQIQQILKDRASLGFTERAVGSGVIEKCAAFAAREHGDARRALELLRVAGEIAEREQVKTVELTHLDRAEDKIEKDRFIDIINSQPKQFQATLYSILRIGQKSDDPIFTGEVYELYKTLCSKIALRPLTQRRVSDIIAELDMLGLINAKIISKGRYGRTREISLSLNEATLNNMRKLLEESLEL